MIHAGDRIKTFTPNPTRSDNSLPDMVLGYYHKDRHKDRHIILGVLLILTCRTRLEVKIKQGLMAVFWCYLELVNSVLGQIDCIGGLVDCEGPGQNIL